MSCCIVFCCYNAGPVSFDYAEWISLYPQFTAVTEQNATALFQQAGLYIDNTMCSPVCDATQRTALLYMLTAHLAWLFSPRNASGNPDSAGTVFPPGLVGRISEATEGSVSVSTDMGGNAQVRDAAWYQQTPWGAAYWAATAQYRLFRYIPSPQRVNGMYGGWPYAGGAYPLGTVARYRRQ